MIRKILLLGFILIIGKSYSQTIADSFELSRKSNKPLLIIRFDQDMVDYPKKFHDKTTDSVLDSLLKSERNFKILIS